MRQASNTGARRHVKPGAQGLLNASVVGPEGQTSASGADEVHMDRLGRERVRFDFQTQTQTQAAETSRSSTWVRVLQRWAGAGMGAQFVPHIGQEAQLEWGNGQGVTPIAPLRAPAMLAMRLSNGAFSC